MHRHTLHQGTSALKSNGFAKGILQFQKIGDDCITVLQCRCHPSAAESILVFQIVTTLYQNTHFCIQLFLKHPKVLVLLRTSFNYLQKNIDFAKDILQFASKTHQRNLPGPQEASKTLPRCLQETSKRLPRRLRNNLNVIMSANLVSTLFFHSLFITCCYLQRTLNP